MGDKQSARLEMGEHDILDAEWILDAPTELFDIFFDRDRRRWGRNAPPE